MPGSVRFTRSTSPLSSFPTFPLFSVLLGIVAACGSAIRNEPAPGLDAGATGTGGAGGPIGVGTPPPFPGGGTGGPLLGAGGAPGAGSDAGTFDPGAPGPPAPGPDAPVAPDVPGCQRLCNGKSCGPDGCGGTCGPCPDNASCNDQGTQCLCNPGHLPDVTREKCIATSATCAAAGVDPRGYCADDRTWVWCDPVHGILSLDCGQRLGSACRQATSGGANGGCACEATAGKAVICADAAGPDQELRLACQEGVYVPSNCRALTGSATGQCSILNRFIMLDQQTSETLCFCGPCSIWAEGACRPAGASCFQSVNFNGCVCTN